ncbi:malonate decarboxylase, epsilon subunit family protein [Enterococcus faecalis 13-SD-W-01]|nr:malonate decarboxylase, epsilon subunit family protein [Enterococcus faecalis 13-SD-W-01]
MSTGFLFPGQGSQKPGMLADVPISYIDRVENVTGYRLIDDEKNYQDTVFIQLALLTKAVFYLDEMEKNEILPDITAGHSIGAFCAAVACGSLTFENAAELVYHRAVLMKEAYPKDYAMGVVVGLTRSEAEKLVKETFTADEPVYLSNENCPMQHTLSGSISGLEKTLAEAKKRQAQTAKLLKVPVPSHCVLMKETVEKFKPYINTVRLTDARCLYLKNTDGRATQDAEEIRKDLLENIAYPVQWNQMMGLAKELGMDLTIEFPPGNTLTKLIHARFGADNGIRTINLDQHGVDDATFLYQKWR